MTIRQLKRTQPPTTLHNPNSPNNPKWIKNKTKNKAPNIPHKFPSNPQQNQPNPYKIREIKMRAKFRGSNRSNRMGFNKGMINKDKREIMWKMRQLQVMLKISKMLDSNLLKSNTLWGQHRDSN